MTKKISIKPLNKSEFIQAFPSISPTAIQERDGEFVIVGKFCLIASLGINRWDLWLCNPKAIDEGLSARKLTSLLGILAQEADFTVLDGEAYANVQGKELIQNNLHLLGIRKKRVISEEQQMMLAEQLKKQRERKHAD